MSLYKPKEPNEPVENKSFRLQYKLKEAARVLNTSPTKLKEWCAEYKIPIYKIGGIGDNFLRHEDLVTLIDRGAIFQNIRAEDFYGKVKESWQHHSESHNA